MWEAGENVTTQAAAQFRKRPGTAYLTNRRLAWVPQGGLAPTVSVKHDDIKGGGDEAIKDQQIYATCRILLLTWNGICPHCLGLFVNSEGSAKAMIKVVEIKPDTSHGFVFTSNNALKERNDFKEGISAILAERNLRANANSGTPRAGSSPAGSPSVSDASGSAPGTPKLSSAQFKMGPGAARRGLNGGAGPSSELKVRFELLKQNKELAMLHKELVMGKHVSEEEFWESRKHLLRNKTAIDQQQKGQSSAWLDLKPQTGESNDVKYIMTPQVIHSVCQQYPSSKGDCFYVAFPHRLYRNRAERGRQAGSSGPIRSMLTVYCVLLSTFVNLVKRAYDAFVPDKLSEGEFWKRYFQSRFFHRSRSGRGANEPDDDIFDKALEEDEEETKSAPKRIKLDHINRLVDLSTTEEDHLEPFTTPDSTMAAGKTKESKEAMPLIRRFNRYAQRVLNSTVGPRKPSTKPEPFNVCVCAFLSLSCIDVVCNGFLIY